MASETINHATLAQLIEADAMRSATVVGVQGGWRVLVRYGMAERQLAAQRDGVRTWRRLDAVAGYLHGLGLARFEVDTANHEDTPDHKRPDQAKAMRQVHDAAEHDRWFKEQVEETRAMLDQMASEKATGAS